MYNTSFILFSSSKCMACDYLKKSQRLLADGLGQQCLCPCSVAGRAASHQVLTASSRCLPLPPSSFSADSVTLGGTQMTVCGRHGPEGAAAMALGVAEFRVLTFLVS